MRQALTIASHKREMLIDITDQVKRVVEASRTHDGIVIIYVQGSRCNRCHYDSGKLGRKCANRCGKFFA